MIGNKIGKDKSIVHDRILGESTAITLSFLALTIMIVGIITFFKYGSWNFGPVLDEAKMGQFGDFIGGLVGTLVALVGIILYYVALKEQRKELRIGQEVLKLQSEALNNQMIEFQKQNEEIVSTRKLYEQQTKTMKKQQFDSNFYSLLSVYRSIKNNLNSNIKNKDFFNTTYSELERGVIKLDDDPFHVTHNKIIDNYTHVYLNHRGKLSSYFKTVYRILKFIDDCDHLKDDEKIFYCKIFRAQISDDELLILYYNYQSIYGFRAQQLVLRYDLLKHVQRLSKIEFTKHFNFPDVNKKNRTILLIEWLIELVHKNISRAKDIENVGSIEIEESFNDYDIIAGVYIDVTVELRIIVKTESLVGLPFKDSDFSDFISLLLLDYFCFDRFKKVVQNSVESSTIKTKEETVFKYVIQEI